MFASSQLDIVIGCDIHMEQLAVGPPAPFPMPYVGMIEASPGGALMAVGIAAAMSWAFNTPPTGPVLVNSLPATKTGDEAKNSKTLPHIIIPPGVAWTPLPKPLKLKVRPPPPPPDNPAVPPGDAVFITGSKTVLFERSNACRLFSLAMSCSDPVRLPSSVIMAMPKGLPVLVGGPPALDYTAAAKAFFLRNKWTAGLLHQIIGLLPPGRARNLLGWAACQLTGHPVDVATGRLLTRSEDYVLRGPIPLVFERFYSSAWAERDSPLGYGWSHTLDERVWVERGRVVYKAGDGREIQFNTYHLPRRKMREGDEIFYPIDRLWLRCEGRGRYSIRSADGLVRDFEPLPRDGSGESRLIRIRNRVKQFVSFEYDNAFCLEAVRTSEGRWLRFEHDRRGRLKRVAVPYPTGGNDAGWYNKVTFAYSPQGDLISATDSANKSRTYEYDAHLLVAETDRDGNVFYFQYDGRDSTARCVRTWGDDKKGCTDLYFRKITYDLKNHRTFVQDSRKRTTVYEMNVANMVVKTLDPHGAATAREFDEHLWLVAETDALGQRTAYAYDARGNTTKRVLPNGATWEAEYNEEDQPVRAVDPMGVVTTVAYDRFSRITDTRTTAGDAVGIVYEGAYPSAVTRSDGTTTRLECDAFGQVVRTVFADGTEEQRQFDRQGRVVKIRDGAGRVRRAVYDLEGRLVGLEHAGGIPETFRHTAEGDVLEAERPGRRAEFGYSHYHKLAYREEAGERVSLRRDGEGDLAAVVNEAGEEYRFERDACGRVAKEISFEGRKRSFVRDALGRVTWEFLPSKASKQFEYDVLSNVTRVSYGNEVEETFAYDVMGRLIEATNAAGTVRFERDSRGRIVKEAFGDAWIETRRDSMGREIGFRTSKGVTEAIERSVMGDVQSVGATGGWSALFERDGVGAETRRRMPGGTEVRRSWDDAGRPKGLVIRRQGDVLAQTEYAWSGLDRLVSKSDAIGGDVEEYVHDARGRLAGARARITAQMMWRAPGPTGDLYRTEGRTDRKYAKGGVLLKDGGTSYAYDANGNVVEKRTDDGKKWAYQWDAAGRLKRVVTGEGKEVTFAYDALGRRVEKKCEGRATKWVWSGNVPVHEWREGGEKKASKPTDWRERLEWKDEWTGDEPELTTWVFEPGGFAPLGKVVRRGENSRALSIVSDFLGTPREMVDAAGKIAWKAQLDVYGAAKVEAGKGEDCPWRWPGQYEDAETGLCYNRFRYYDKERGAYLSQDPIRLAGGMRLFGYVEQPLVQTDVLGLSEDGGCAPPKTGDSSQPVDAAAIAAQFEKSFGAQPEAMYLVGSRAEKALGNAALDVSRSDVDVFIQTSLDLSKHEGAGFEFFKAVNPGRVPDWVTGIGPGVGQAFIGDQIPKPGLIDPFFGKAGDLIPGAPAIPLKW